MIIRDALYSARSSLEEAKSDTAHLDAALLLSHAARMTREKLYMKLSDPLGDAELKIYDTYLERRISGEPVAWILGKKDFWKSSFKVGPHVFCPRPDSEILVERTLEVMDQVIFDAASKCLHDSCCGPGTIALSLAAERPEWNIGASDISTEAERYFRWNNADLCDGRVEFTRSDLLEDVEGKWDIIVANPPYLSPEETIDRGAPGRLEPQLALDGGGKDGLNIIRRLIQQASVRLKSNGRLLLEANPLQMKAINKILKYSGFADIRIHDDLGKRGRVIEGQFLE